jgi:multidrug resistance efflux pump
MEKQSIFKKPWVQSIIGIVVIVLCLLGLIVYKSLSSKVSIDTSMIEAPIINIGPQSEGVLQQVSVQEGDMVTKGETVAQVGGEVLTAQVDGLVIAVNNVPGEVVMPGQMVVSMIEPKELRVVGTIDEDKGLSKIAVGDTATFTVDAFGGQTFTGIVDEISPTSDDTSIAFSISDKRPTKQFDVKVLYDVAAHPEFKNGMSAKLNIYPKS